MKGQKDRLEEGCRNTEDEQAASVLDICRSEWNFHERQDRGKGVVTSWIKKDRLSVRAQASLERSIDQLRALPKTKWCKPAPASFMENHTYVIRFKDVGHVQLRVYGHFYDAHKAFVMTANGYEKDNVYYPENYAEIAKSYKELCDKNFIGYTVAFRNYCQVCVQQKNPQSRFEVGLRQ